MPRDLILRDKRKVFQNPAVINMKCALSVILVGL